jgi:hypothetical protein
VRTADAESPVTPATRFVIWADLIGVLLAGSQFALFPDRTEELASWTIAVPLTAAFLGFGYWAALPSMVLALRMRGWERVRILPVMALVLTTLVMVATLRDLDAFHLDEGAVLARTAAWAWLILYAVLPPLNLGVLILQERRSAGRPVVVERAILAWVRALLLLYALGLSVVGFGLLFASAALEGLWPWPLTRLSAAAIGAFLLMLATGCGWALREDDWTRFRLAVPFFLIWFPAQVAAAILHRADFEVPGPGIWAYVGALVVSFALFALAAWRQERPPTRS